jgi:hypothetical protein
VARGEGVFLFLKDVKRAALGAMVVSLTPLYRAKGSQMSSADI